MIDSFVLYMLMPRTHVCIVIDIPGSPQIDGKPRLRTSFQRQGSENPKLVAAGWACHISEGLGSAQNRTT